jgi:hypothetical protein
MLVLIVLRGSDDNDPSAAQLHWNDPHTAAPQMAILHPIEYQLTSQANVFCLCRISCHMLRAADTGPCGFSVAHVVGESFSVINRSTRCSQ